MEIFKFSLFILAYPEWSSDVAKTIHGEKKLSILYFYVGNANQWHFRSTT